MEENQLKNTIEKTIELYGGVIANGWFTLFADDTQPRRTTHGWEDT